MLTIYHKDLKASSEIRKSFLDFKDLFLNFMDYLEEIAPSFDISESRKRENLESIKKKSQIITSNKMKFEKENKDLKEKKVKYKMLLEIKDLIADMKENASFIDKNVHQKISDLMTNIENSDIQDVKKIKSKIKEMLTKI